MKKLTLKKETITVLEKDAMNAFLGGNDLYPDLKTKLGATCYESRLVSYCHFSPCSGFQSCNTAQKYCTIKKEDIKA